MGVYLLTGGSGTIGTALTKQLLSAGHKVRTLSRNEHSIQTLHRSIDPKHHVNLSCLIGDVRDIDRLMMAMRGVDYCIHAAAIKVIQLCEYDPKEAVLTNVLGSINVVDASIKSDVKRTVLISSDKEVLPVNCYGMTKGCAEKVFLASNRYCGAGDKKFVIARYGNVWNSNGSVAGVWKKQAEAGQLRITNREATRFHWKIDEAVNFVLDVTHNAAPETIHVPKLPSYKLGELADAFERVYEVPRPAEIIGLTPGEKLHETMVSEFESYQAEDKADRYILHHQRPVCEGGWAYMSSTNWKLGRQHLEDLIRETFR